MRVGDSIIVSNMEKGTTFKGFITGVASAYKNIGQRYDVIHFVPNRRGFRPVCELYSAIINPHINFNYARLVLIEKRVLDIRKNVDSDDVHVSFV